MTWWRNHKIVISDCGNGKDEPLLDQGSTVNDSGTATNSIQHVRLVRHIAQLNQKYIAVRTS